MHYLHKYFDFTDSEEGNLNLAKAEVLRDQMTGQFYFGLLSEDCDEIRNKLNSVILVEKSQLIQSDENEISTT